MPIVTGQISTVIYPRQEQQVSQESQESRQFWTEQGYPQYGGRYAPVEVPEGYRISRVVETETGLRVIFTKPYVKSFPIKETKEGMVLEPLQTAEVNKIVGIGRARQPSTKIYYFEPPSKEETEAYFERQEAYRKAVESGKLKFLPRYIHYTGYGHATSPYLPPYKPGLVNPFTGKPFASVKEWQKENARQYSEYQASVKFWTEQGYPEFAGKYKVPTVPEGYTLLIDKKPVEIHNAGVVSIGFEPVLSIQPTQETINQTTKQYGLSEKEAYDILTSKTFYLNKGQLVYEPKGFYKPTNLFGPTVYVMTEEGLVPKYALDNKIPIVEGEGLTLEEQEALMGISSTAIVATPLIQPLLTVPALASLGIGETVKYAMTGQPLTLSEAITVVGLGEIAGSLLIELAPHVPAINRLKTETSKAIQNWLIEKQYKPSTGYFIKEGIKPFESEFAFVKPSGIGPVESEIQGGITWQGKTVMYLTGVKPPYLPYAEISIPIAETVKMETIPSSLPYTEMGWELTEAPRTSGILITKIPTPTSEKGLELFFGLGEELIPFSKAEGEGATLYFKKQTVSATPIKATEENLPANILEESYYPKMYFEKTALTEINVKGFLSFRTWPTVKELMAEQKLLPMVTQTQVTRMGIYPYVPEIAIQTPEIESALMPMLFFAMPKIFSTPKITRETEKATLTPTLFEIITPKRLNETRKKPIPFVFFNIDLTPTTRIASKSHIENIVSQETATIETTLLKQVQTQISEQIQALRQDNIMNTKLQIPKSENPLDDFKKLFKPKIARKRKQGYGFYVWEFPILDPEKVWKLK